MMKNQGQNGVQKQAMSKKVRESALMRHKRGKPTDSVSVGGSTDGLVGLVEMSVDLCHAIGEIVSMKSIDYTSDSLHPTFHGQVMSIRKDGTARDGVALIPGHLF